MAKASDPPDDDDDSTDFPGVSDQIDDQLGPIEKEVYVDWRTELLTWAAEEGKNPELGEGYSEVSLQQHAYRIDRFASWVFGEFEFRSFSKDIADQYWKTVLKPDDNKLATNRKDANSIALIFKKRSYDSEDSEEWKIPNSEDIYEEINKKAGTNFTGWFSVNELEKIKHASLRAYAVPDRTSMDDDEIDDWAAHLAQRLRKPKSDLSESDWETAASFKIPSLVYASCDLGFRPKEVERSRWGWFDVDDGTLRIDKDESSKNSDNWHCYLGDDTTRLLKKWKVECYGDEKPAPSDPVWLTRENNPYSADSLSHLLENLMMEAGIDTRERETGWYMIRRGVGTDLASKQDIQEVMAQLRIKNVQTANRYIRHDERAVRDWLSSR